MVWTSAISIHRVYINKIDMAEFIARIARSNFKQQIFKIYFILYVVDSL